MAWKIVIGVVIVGILVSVSFLARWITTRTSAARLAELRLTQGKAGIASTRPMIASAIQLPKIVVTCTHSKLTIYLVNDSDQTIRFDIERDHVDVESANFGRVVHMKDFTSESNLLPGRKTAALSIEVPKSRKPQNVAIRFVHVESPGTEMRTETTVRCAD